MVQGPIDLVKSLDYAPEWAQIVVISLIIGPFSPVLGHFGPISWIFYYKIENAREMLVEVFKCSILHFK